MNEEANRIATDFVRRYERAWSVGADAASSMYTDDGVLVGFVTASGRQEIASLVAGIVGQGWTGVQIRVVNARRASGVILVACEYTAIGSGAQMGKTTDAKSSYVLVQTEGDWLATLHTAT